MTDQANTSIPKAKNPFFFRASIITLCFVILAFGLKVIVHPVRLVRYGMPSVLLHAVLMILWLGLCVVQTSLVQRRNINLHKKLGWLSIALVVSLIVSGMTISYNLSREFNRPQLFAINFYMLLSFILLYGGAIYYAIKKRIDWHKRLVFIGGLNLLLPAYVRWCDVIGVSKSHSEHFHLLLILLVPLAYDWFTSKRIHKASLIGVIVTYLIFGFGLVFMAEIAEIVKSIL